MCQSVSIIFNPSTQLFGCFHPKKYIHLAARSASLAASLHNADARAGLCLGPVLAPQVEGFGDPPMFQNTQLKNAGWKDEMVLQKKNSNF